MIIFGLALLNGCVDPTTGRDTFGNIMPGDYATAVKIGQNKYYVEANFQKDAIRGARETCAGKGQEVEVISIDNSGKWPTVMFSCY